ncbi:hypothetical protein [Nitrosopumilus sp. S4]
MVEDIGKEYRDTMQEVMLELKFSTISFLNKFKEGNKRSEKDNFAIPIVISVKGQIRDFEIDVFGLGETLKAPLLLEVPGLKNTRVVNQNTMIIKGLTLLHGKNQFFNPNKESEYSEYNYVLFGSKKILSEASLDKASEWFQRKILSKDCKLKIKDKEINNVEELKNSLNEICQKF